MSERAVLTVSQLSAQLAAVMEERFPAIWIEGEISNFKVYGSGHAYFTLKDEQAQIRCVLFRTRGRRVRFEPKDGLHVMAFGSVEVYAQRGEYQLVVELLEPRGVGALQLAFEQLKERLSAEGLFATVRKRPLPRFPRKIGIVTSPSGAALRDMLRVIGRRFGEIHIVLAPARVQGDGAAAEVAQGIRELNALGGVDVIIVGRGGGSLEDLWAFNDEMLARTIAASKIPVISAVGHEVDFTIADFVADVRAATPSNAAELVVKEKRAVVESLADLGARLTRAIERVVALRRERLERTRGRRVLTDPGRPLRDLERRLDDARARLRQAALSAVRRGEHRVALASRGLRALNPVTHTLNSRRTLTDLRGRLDRGLRQRLLRAQHDLGVAAGRLDSLSPLAVLGRGYSLTLTPGRRIVRSWRDVSTGDAVRVLLHEGSLDCRVDATREHDDRPQV
ncbi:MAG TPA: exodeoxyribonuclease VII large subunit [Methylomirabilota bacterium]|jgi:exodeoxyribonuclease VII large subunit|nr:exodeoxyribonuclease VII large subunit [Methylomirabilota bacterium]